MLFEPLLKEVASLQYSEAELLHALNNDDLYEIYSQLNKSSLRIQDLAPLAKVNLLSTKLFDEASAKLLKYQEKCVDLFEQKINEHSHLGNTSAYEKPDVVVVLGANPSVIKTRMDCAIQFLPKHPSAKVVLSGAGFSPSQSEAQEMLTIYQQSGLNNDVFLEEDSMDTIGNALFSKFLIQGKGLGHEKLNLLIITSDFHSIRALAYFYQIFGKTNTNIACLEAKSGPNMPLKKLIAHEMTSEDQAAESLQIFTKKENQLNGELLYDLVIKHPLYKNRFDLLRKLLVPLTS